MTKHRGLQLKIASASITIAQFLIRAVAGGAKKRTQRSHRRYGRHQRIPFFSERRQKVFAGFLLDDRKEKKRCYNVFTTSITDSTLPRRTDQTTLLRKETKPVETLKEKTNREKINATDELPHLVLWPTGID